MELADYLRVLRRRWWLVLIVMLVCSSGAAAATYAKAPRYTATTELNVSGGSPNGAIDEIARRQLANQRAVAYAQLAGTGPAQAAATEAAKAVSANPATTAVADGTRPFITITVVANSAASAQAIANAYVVVLPDVIRRLEQTPSSVSPDITTLTAASLPSSPTSPIHQRDILVGVVLGLILGIAGALIRETLDARLRDSMEIEKATGTMLLGSVPKENSSEVLVSATRPRSGRAEAYRHIRTNLEFTGPGGMPKSIVVTSPAPGEGKSSLSANLAIVAARSGRNVALIDADLRKPAIAKYFGLNATVGLADVLAGEWSWQEAMVPLQGERIHILPSGAIPRFPSELVGSARMAQLIQELEATYDLVIIDTPPVLPVSDALIMGVNAGGVVLVARMKETRRAAIKRAVEAVTKVDANLLGIVANAAVRREEKAYGEGYGYAYGYIQKNAKGGADAVPPAMEPATRRRSGRHSDAPPAPPAAAADVFPPNGYQSPAEPPPYAGPAGRGGYQSPAEPPPYPGPRGGYQEPGSRNGYHQPLLQNGYQQPGSRNGYQEPLPQNGHQEPSAQNGYAPGVSGPSAPDPYRLSPDETRPVMPLHRWPTQQAGPVSPVEPMKLDDIIHRPPRQ